MAIWYIYINKENNINITSTLYTFFFFLSLEDLWGKNLEMVINL